MYSYYKTYGGAAVAEWLSSWLAEQEDRGSIPGLATWIFRDWLSPASKSRYGWKIAKSTLILKTTNQPTNKTYGNIKLTKNVHKGVISQVDNTNVTLYNIKKYLCYIIFHRDQYFTCFDEYYHTPDNAPMSFYLLEINHVAPITTCSTEPSEQSSLIDEWHNDFNYINNNKSKAWLL